MQRAAPLPSCPHCFASSAALLRLGSLKCASASPVTHREACHVPFDWRLDLLEERGLSLTWFSAPKYVWTEMRTFRENEKLRSKRGGRESEKKKDRMLCLCFRRILVPCVCCVFTWAVACMCLCMYSCVCSCSHICVWRWDLSLLSLIWCFLAKPSNPAQGDRYAGVFWQGSSAGRTCYTGPQGAATPWGQTEEQRDTLPSTRR